MSYIYSKLGGGQNGKKILQSGYEPRAMALGVAQNSTNMCPSPARHASSSPPFYRSRQLGFFSHSLSCDSARRPNRAAARLNPAWGLAKSATSGRRRLDAGVGPGGWTAGPVGWGAEGYSLVDGFNGNVFLFQCNMQRLSVVRA